MELNIIQKALKKQFFAVLILILVLLIWDFNGFAFLGKKNGKKRATPTVFEPVRDVGRSQQISNLSL